MAAESATQSGQAGSAPSPAVDRGDARAERTNAQWLEALRRRGAGDGGAAADLRTFLRRGLRHVLARRGEGEHDVEDFVHDAVVRVLEHLASFRGDSRFTTWAMAVAIRGAFGTLRRRRREQLLGDADPMQLDGVLAAPPSPPDAGRLLDRRTVLGALRAAVHDGLTARQRAAVLGELAGVPSEELAHRLGTSRGALYKLHHDARRKLRQAILDAGFSEDDVRQELAAASEEA